VNDIAALEMNMILMILQIVVERPIIITNNSRPVRWNGDGDGAGMVQ